SSPPARHPWRPVAGTAPRDGRSAPIWSSCSPLVASSIAVFVELGLEQGAEIGRAGVGARVLRADPLHRLALVGVVLGLDREVDAAVLAVDVDDHRRHRVTLLHPRAQVLDAVARDLRRAEIALDIAPERADRPLA